MKSFINSRGMITTYLEIANSLDSNAYRAVGNAMAKILNLFLCHVIVLLEVTDH